MQRKIKIGDAYVVPIEEYMVDSYDEIIISKEITRAPQGSEVYVIKESKRYVKDSEGDFYLKNCNGGG